MSKRKREDIDKIIESYDESDEEVQEKESTPPSKKIKKEVLDLIENFDEEEEPKPEPVEPKKTAQPEKKLTKKQAEKKKKKKERRESKKNVPDSKLFGANVEELSEAEAQRMSDLHKKQPGRPYTVSIAIPGSILKSLRMESEMTNLVSRIARACAIHKVNEIIVYSEEGKIIEQEDENALSEDFNVYFANILQFLETPPYLRQEFFNPEHPNLKFMNSAYPLETPHHVRGSDIVIVREGVIREPGKAYVGLKNLCEVDNKDVPKGTRVTVKLDIKTVGSYGTQKGELVSPSYPWEKLGIYWGYTTRLASSFTKIFKECPYKDGYDLVLGVGLEGKFINSFATKMPKFSHLLIVFPSQNGYQASLFNDEDAIEKKASSYFDFLINICPNMGTKNLLVEEQVSLCLSQLFHRISNNKLPKELPKHAQIRQEKFKKIIK